MAALTDDVKLFVVQALACYDTPTQVAHAVKAEYGLVVSPQQCEAYDPAKRCAAKLSKKWRDIFAETRKNFLENTSTIPIANRAVRLRILQRMIENAEKSKNIALAAQLIEQAAKESGGVYTNKQKVELTGKDGQPVQAVNMNQEQFKEIASQVAANV